MRRTLNRVRLSCSERLGQFGEAIEAGKCAPLPCCLRGRLAARQVFRAVEHRIRLLRVMHEADCVVAVEGSERSPARSKAADY